MVRVYCLLLVLWASGFGGGALTASAQNGSPSPAVRTVGTTANLFETLDPGSAVVAVRLRLPETWEVRDVRVLRYGTVPVSATYARTEEGYILVRPERSLEGPHEFILRVEFGSVPGTYRWQLTPMRRIPTSAPGGSAQLSRRRTVLSNAVVTRQVELEAPTEVDGANRVLDLQGAARPLQVDLPDRVRLGREASFTLEFWLRTSGLDEVLISTWTGRETASYPAEVVVDQSGRLRFYCGKAGQHQALRAMTPVADDRWHHAAVVYDASTSKLRLLVDGTVVDSTRARNMPVRDPSRALAIGGRLPVAGPDTTVDRQYSGRIDAVRLWPEARSVGSLRRTKSRPVSGADGGDPNGPFYLGFDRAPDESRIDWPSGARRVQSSLTFRSPLHDLRAHTEGNTVTLRWQAEDASETTFIVERSFDGTSFTSVARLRPFERSPETASQEVTYTDEEVSGQVVFYRIRQIDEEDAVERTTGTIKIGLGAEATDQNSLVLVGNFPNPFEESTTIAYRVNEPQSLTLSVWNLSGKRIATLAEGRHDTGYYERTLRAGDLPSGTYFARLQTAMGVQSHRMVLLK